MNDCLRHCHGDQFYLVIRLFTYYCEVLCIVLHDHTFDDTSRRSCPLPLAFFDARLEFDCGVHLAELLQFNLVTSASDVWRKLTDLVLSGVEHLLLAQKVFVVIIDTVLIYSGYVIGLIAVLERIPRVVSIHLQIRTLSIRIPLIGMRICISLELCILYKCFFSDGE